MVDPTNYNVFFHHEGRWNLMQPKHNSRHRLTNTNTTTTLPINVVPITINNVTTTPTLTFFVLQLQKLLTPTINNPSDLYFYIKTLPINKQKVLGLILELEPDELNKLVSAICHHWFSLGFDGSVSSGKLSYSYRIQSNNNIFSFINSCSLHDTHSIFRSEGFSHLATLYLLRAIVTFYKIIPSNASPIPAYIDNKGLIQQLSHGLPTPLKYTIYNDADLIRKIRAVAATIPFIIQRNHVRSRQYDNRQLKEIPLPNLINLGCDKLCEVAYQTNDRPPIKNIIFSSTTTYLKYDNRIITTKIQQELLFSTHDRAFCEY